MTILDVHFHFFSNTTFKAFEKTFGPVNQDNFRQQNPERFKKIMEIPGPEERAKQLIENMKKNEIDYILPMAFVADEESSFMIHNKFPEYFPGIIPFLSPDYHKDPSILDDWKKKGAVSVKLYPSAWSEKYSLSSPELLPYFKKMTELDISPIVHCGVVKGGDVSTYWPVNPLELRPWLTNPDLKDLRFVIAHFGAGYLREILMMAYAHGNQLYVDTSGSNDWIFWSDWIDLTQVFEKSIKALGSSHILFGTDSNIELLRPDVITRQKGILQDLVTKKIINIGDVEKIYLNNAKELFNIKFK